MFIGRLSLGTFRSKILDLFVPLIFQIVSEVMNFDLSDAQGEFAIGWSTRSRPHLTKKTCTVTFPLLAF